MTDPNPYPKADYGRNTNSPEVLIIGAGISVLSHLYSYSFAPNANWTREYPGQEEIQDHLISVAHKYQLYKHIRFNSCVNEARWDDVDNKWRTTIRRFGQEAEKGACYTVTSDFLVSAVGQLNVPKYPEIPGLNTFRGKVMHSARWDWDYQIVGKKVGIVGTGATAAQIIPEIAQSTSQLVVFQRTPAWVMPRHDKPISPIRQTVYKYIPFARRRYRASLMDFRESVFDAAYDPRSAKHSHIAHISRQHMQSQLPSCASTKLREALTPNYPFSCKRIIVSDDFYPSLLHDNVHLETSSIACITPTGITMANGTHHELDLIVLATGFRTTDFMYPIRIFGSGGRSLSDAWSKGASAYLGITVENLPNFGMLYGPNTNLAYNSLILQIEAQSLYVNALIAAVLCAKRQGKTLTLEPKHEIVEAYNEEVQEKLKKSTYADPRCTSWFKDEKGRITTNWCGSAVDYQKRISYVDWGDFEILGTGAAEVEKRGQTRWGRRIEETQVSNRTLGMGATAIVLLAGLVGWKAWNRV